MRRLTVVRVTLAIAVVVAMARLLAPASLELLDLKLLDARYRVRGPLLPAGDVVIVGVDEASLDEIGRWPWPRGRLAMLVDRLRAGGATAIGFDMVFGQADQSLDLAALRAAADAAPGRPAREVMDGLLVDQDTRLADALRGSGRAVLGYYVDLSGEPAAGLAGAAAHLPELSVRAAANVAPERFLEHATRLHASIPVLAAASAAAGHFNFLPDSDGLYRRLPLALEVGGRLVPALGLELARRHAGGVPALLTVGAGGVTGLSLGAASPPVDGRAGLWMNFLGPARTFTHLRAADLIAGRTDPTVVTGKVAIVGFTAAGFDEVATPFTAVQPGVELQATVVDNLLHGRALWRPWWIVPVEAAFVLLLGFGVGLVLRRWGALTGAVVAAGLTLVFAVVTQALFVSAGLATGGLYPIGALVLCTLGGAVFRATVEEAEKRQVRNAFRRYLNPEVTDMLARDPSRLRLGGERREITILFSDIRGFTGISERLDAPVLADLLNQYLGAMTDIVFRHAGLLDKYVGDALMAFWGAPVDAPDHGARCCRAALDMLAELTVLQDRWQRVGLPPIDIRVGLNSGQAAVGNFGSPQRFSYTAVGDSVNLASRLEGLNLVYGTHILLSEVTRRAAGEEFVCREIDRVRVVGRRQPLGIHELLGRRADDRDGLLAKRAAAYEDALRAYRRQAWDDAIGQVDALLKHAPRDTAALGLRARCEGFRAAPPGAGWEAVFDATTK